MMSRTVLGLSLFLLACSGPQLPAATPPPQPAQRGAEPLVAGEREQGTQPLSGEEREQAPEELAILRLPVPPFTAQPMQAPGIDVGPFVSVRLVEVQRRKNQVTDLDAWIARHQIELLSRELDAGRRAELAVRGVPPTIAGTAASRELVHADHSVVLYDAPEQRGRYLVVLRGDALSGPFDFEAFREPPQGEGAFTAMETRWAQAVGDTLLVSHAHRTYAESSAGHNAYVSALSLADGTLRWRSPPLTSNAEECVFSAGSLVCGYGFTAEPDFLYLLDARTGQVTQKVKVASGPEHLYLRGDELFVRAYDTDYVFALR